VVVAVGLMVVEPVEEVDVNDPGVIAIVVAPVADQLRVLPDPALMLDGLAVKDAMVGMDAFPVGELEDDPPQPASPAQATKRAVAQNFSPAERSSREVGLGPQIECSCI